MSSLESEFHRIVHKFLKFLYKCLKSLHSRGLESFQDVESLYSTPLFPIGVAKSLLCRVSWTLSEVVRPREPVRGPSLEAYQRRKRDARP